MKRRTLTPDETAEERRDIARLLAERKRLMGRLEEVDMALQRYGRHFAEFPSKEPFGETHPVGVSARSCVYVLGAGPFLKVGFTSQFTRRWNAYRGHNRQIYYVGSWPGGADEELQAFDELTHLGIHPIDGGEWYVNTSEMLAWAQNKSAVAGQWWRATPADLERARDAVSLSPRGIP